MTERRSDKWFGVALSVVVHAAIAAALVWGFWFYGKPKSTPPPQLAIEATVIDSASLPAGTLPRITPAPPAPVPEPVREPEPAPEPEAAPPPPEPEPPPPDDSAQREQELQEAERREQERVERERVEQQRVAQERAAQERAAQQKAAQEKAAQEKAAQDKAAREKAAQEEKVRQEAERLAREKAAKDKADRERAEREAAERDRQRQADERLRQQREGELRAQLAAEERANAMRNSSQMQNYVAMIAARIERAWIRPPSARPGLSCQVRVSQTPSGDVTGAQVLACNGDEAVRQSIEAAVYRASPLPVAPDPALFDRNLVFNFRPEE